MNKILLEVIGLTYSHSQSGAYALILGEKGSNKRLPIIIGSFEAQSIAVALEKFDNQRPLTHDLFKTFADTYDISLKEVIVNRFKEGLFFSEIHTVKDGEVSVLDARTSDAVAIALRFKSPIYTYPQVMEEAGIIMDDIDFEDDSDDKTEDVSENIFDRYDIHELQELLQDAIDNEDYERASIIRDEINIRKK